MFISGYQSRDFSSVPGFGQFLRSYNSFFLVSLLSVDYVHEHLIAVFCIGGPRIGVFKVHFVQLSDMF